MAVRGVYTEEEKKMIADFEKKAGTVAGWAKSLTKRVASEESIRNEACGADWWNPLWRDENYAINTRWGGIIAPPIYQDTFLRGASFLVVPPSVGYLTRWYIGEDWEFFQPIRVNDSFKVWRKPSKLTDVTEEGGPRTFKLLASESRLINQRDELVNTHRLHFELIIVPEPPKEAEFEPDYIYTREELAYIDRIADEEEIRGANIRYWEDVSVGEEPRWVVHGPTTMWDQVVNMGTGGLPMREMRKRMPEALILDPVTGVTHADVEWHLSDRQAQIRGEPRAYLRGATSRQLMARFVTNWMGDDGFLRRFDWRHLARTIIGDTIIGKGQVINKHVENGEHLVDLAVWTENIRGNITDAAMVTVSLFSKEDI